MGSLILCHKKRAVQPYMITRIHMKIYTIEELCYYICNNLYLIDHTLMNQQLCEWLAEELELTKLSDLLRKALAKNCTVEQFVLTVLQGSDIYGLSEIHKIQGLLEKLQNQKDVMRLKYKGDSLLRRKEYASAILVYQSIVGAERDHSVTKEFYGKIYGCLGAAYGNMFLYCGGIQRRMEALRRQRYVESLCVLLLPIYASGGLCKNAFGQSEVSEHGCTFERGA